MEMEMKIFELLIRLAVLIMAGIIIPAFRQWLSARTDNEKLERVKAWARTAVAAAEQMYRKYDDPHGTERKKYATDAILLMSSKCGIHLTKEEVETMIEAAVQEINLIENRSTIDV